MTDEPLSIEQEAERARLDAGYEAEDVRLRLQLAGYAGVALFVLLLFMLPILAELLHGETGHLVIWVIGSVPLLTLAVTIWRWQRVPDGEGGYITGRRARFAAVRMVAQQYAIGRMGPIGVIIRQLASRSRRDDPPKA